MTTATMCISPKTEVYDSLGYDVEYKRRPLTKGRLFSYLRGGDHFTCCIEKRERLLVLLICRIEKGGRLLVLLICHK